MTRRNPRSSSARACPAAFASAARGLYNREMFPRGSQTGSFVGIARLCLMRSLGGIGVLSLALAASAAQANKTGLPNPEEADLPYLIHASSLLATERSEVREETRKKERYYTLPGAASPAQTPLASPEFLFRSEKIDPKDLQLYPFTSKGGRRELLFQKKKKFVSRAIRLSVYPVDGELVKIRVDESLPPGQYCLTPPGSNTVFCFAVF
jgi:hypothetical protein